MKTERSTINRLLTTSSIFATFCTPREIPVLRIPSWVTYTFPREATQQNVARRRGTVLRNRSFWLRMQRACQLRVAERPMWATTRWLRVFAVPGATRPEKCRQERVTVTALWELPGNSELVHNFSFGTAPARALARGRSNGTAGGTSGSPINFAFSLFRSSSNTKLPAHAPGQSA